MGKRDIAKKIARGWDILAEAYQRNTVISTEDVHYGPLAYGEKRLRLLGDVEGKTALEIGCGGGQNAIALVRWGARAYGVDPSRKQIEHARRLSQKCGTDVVFHVAPAENLGLFKDWQFDLALSSHAFGYVGDLRRAYREAYRTLKPGGLFVLCIGNPFYLVLSYYLSGNKKEGIEKDYLSWPSIEKWTWEYEGGPSVEMWGYARTISQMVNPLLETGFTLERMVEQGVEDVAHMSKREKADIPYLCRWSEEEFAIAKKVPYSFILKLKRGGSTRRSSRVI